MATIGADARLSAAEARAQRFMHVPGGQEIAAIDGMPTTIKRPDRVLDISSGLFLDAQPAAAMPPTPPKIGEARTGQFRFKGGDPYKQASWEKVQAMAGPWEAWRHCRTAPSR